MNRLLITLLLVSAIFISCATSKVAMSDSEYNLTDQNVAIMEMEFSERDFPIIPLIDVGLYKKAVSSVEDSLNEVEENKQNEMNDFYRDEIAKRLGKDIVTIPNVLSSLSESVNTDPSEELKSSFRDVIEDTDAGYLLVPTARVITSDVSAFGIKGFSYLKSELYIFDRNGELIADGQYSSKLISGRPKDIKSYESVINQYETLAPELLNLMIH